MDYHKGNNNVSQRKVGAILSYVGLVVNAIASFVYVPLLLGFLTTQEYGVYELIGSIIAYLSVMDMGLSTTLNRFYVREKTLGDKTKVENLLAMAAIIYAVLTALAVAVGFCFDAALDPLMGETFTAGELELAHQMMLLVILNCVVVLPGNWFLALINANERFIFARSLSIAKYVLQVVIVLAVLSWRSNALLVLVVQVALNMISVLAYIAYVKGRLRIRAKFHRWDWALFRSLLAFSFFILLNMVFDQIHWKTGQVVLGAVSGASAVAVYGVVCKLMQHGFVQVSTGVTSVFLPKLTAISAQTDDMAEINELFCRIGRIQAMLVWGVLAAFIALGEQFILLWAGPDFIEAYPATVVLMISLAIPLVENLGISVLQAKNKMAFRSVAYTIFALVYVVVSIPASSAFGIMGCAVSGAMVLLIQNGPVINWYYHFKIGIDIPAFFRQVAPLVLPAALSCATTCAICKFLITGLSWGSFLLGAVLFCIVYFALLWFFWMNDYEHGLVLSFLKKFGRSKKGSE